MKRYALLLTAALGMAAAQTSTAPTPAGLADAGLSGSNVTFELRRAGGDMASMLVALAKSAGYEIILEPGVDAALRGGTGDAAQTSPGSAQVSYSFANKPFNEVWPLVLDLYGLSYETLNVGGRPVLRVSAKPVQKIVKLPDALSASLVERQLKLSFGSVKAGGTQGGGAPGTSATTTPDEIVLDSPTMRIVAEPTSNSIIIRGTNQEVASVERLLSGIVAAQPTALRAAGQDAQRLYTVRGAQADVTALLAAQYPGLKVAPVGQTGRLVVTGPQAQIEAAFALLDQVDRPTATTAAGRSIYAVKGQQADITALLAAQYPDLKVTPVGQTGQLVLTGAQPQLDAALALLGQVDRAAPVQSGPAVVQRVFQLVNASAEEVKATLEGTLARELSAAPGTAQPTGSTVLDVNGNPVSLLTPATPGTQTAQPAASTPSTTAVTLIADKRTNTLIARGTATQVAQIADLIPQLDGRVPQINVQVRIQEITETAARSLGVNWKAGFGGFTVSSSGTTGLTAAFDPTQSLFGFNLGASLNALENQGLSKSVYDGNITMQSGQRSLGAGTDTQNTSSGAAASIKSGGRLELNIPSNAANVPPIQKQIDYGVNLDFFNPQVAPDGTITVRVRGQVNDLKTAVTAATVPNLLNFANSEAQTTLTFKTGETLILSGLLSTKESTTNGGVPFLSSLPIVGPLFGTKSTNRSQTQLLVVITGNIVK